MPRRRTMGLKPLGDRVVVEPKELKEVVQGGIVLPESAKEKPTEGVVVEVGPGELLESGERVPMPVKVGDVVIYGKWAGTDIEIDGKDVKILSVSDIMAVRE
ncbi:MAG: co-chaperone GroES [Armatimonadetes bacterium]|nr:co-chaperone GroES [Armatimonadota bacterium]